MRDPYVFHLRLSQNDPLHREALAIIHGIPKGRRTSEICHMLIAAQKENDLKHFLSETIREALQKNISALPIQPQQPNKTQPTTNFQGEGITDDILSFLSDLQEGGEL